MVNGNPNPVTVDLLQPKISFCCPARSQRRFRPEAPDACPIQEATARTLSAIRSCRLHALGISGAESTSQFATLITGLFKACTEAFSWQACRIPQTTIKTNPGACRPYLLGLPIGENTRCVTGESGSKPTHRLRNLRIRLGLPADGIYGGRGIRPRPGSEIRQPGDR